MVLNGKSEWRTNLWPHVRSNRRMYTVLLLCSVLFWFLRFEYWHETYEVPFSDMWGYVVTGDNIYNHFFFGHDESRPTYLTPVTPSLIAIAKLIASTHFERPFRLIVQIITFFSALLLVREIALLTGRKWVAASFLLIVAICRPSIFWSLKFATEPVCEAFLYATFAAALATLRSRSWRSAVLCGFFALCLGLNRPNFLAGTMLIPLAFLLQDWRRRRAESAVRWTSIPGSRAIFIATMFLIAFFATWSIWVGRNLINYGAPILTSSSGAQSALWDFGAGPVKVGRYDSLTLEDGSTFTNFGKVMEEAGRYQPDYEGAKHLFMIARAWYAANWMDLPRAFFWRLKNLLAFNGASGLSKVPRDHIFFTQTPGYNDPYAPVGWLDVILLDKTSFNCLLGLAGLGFFAWRFPAAGLVMAGLALAPWVMAALVIGYERTVESLIAITIWLALYGTSEIVARLNARETPG